MEVGGLVDAINVRSTKWCWTRAKVIGLTEDKVEVAYLNDPKNRRKAFPLSAREIAPYGSKKDKYQWREALRVGDKVDFIPKTQRVEAKVMEVLENDMVNLALVSA